MAPNRKESNVATNSATDKKEKCQQLPGGRDRGYNRATGKDLAGLRNTERLGGAHEG